MTDRSRRRTAASDSAERAPREDNPFAAPPEGSPDQPWQPRLPADHRGQRSGDGRDGAGYGQGTAGPGTGGGNGSETGNGQGDSDSGGSDPGGSASGGPGTPNSGPGGSDSGDEGSGSVQPSGDDPVWGSRWSSRQPGRGSGGFGGPAPGQGGGPGDGGRPGDDDGFGGPGTGGGGPGGGRGLRWDPTDPLQRHARYSLHAGVWALFFALFSLPEVALLLSALSLYWGIHALHGGRKDSGKSRGGKRGARATAEDIAGSDRTHTEAGAPDATPAAPPVPVIATPEQRARSQRNAAIGGLVLAALAICVIASAFAFQMVYQDYFACTHDALTQPSRDQCKHLLPPELRPFLQGR